MGSLLCARFSEPQNWLPLAAVRSVSAMANPDSSSLLVLVNFHRFLQSAEIVQALAHQLTAGKQNRTFVLILSPLVQIPTELEKQFPPDAIFSGGKWTVGEIVVPRR